MRFVIRLEASSICPDPACAFVPQVIRSEVGDTTTPLPRGRKHQPKSARKQALRTPGTQARIDGDWEEDPQWEDEEEWAQVAASPVVRAARRPLSQSLTPPRAQSQRPRCRFSAGERR